MDPPEGVKPTERKWIYKETDVDDLIHKRIDLSKRVYDKVQRVDYKRIGSLVAMFKSVWIILAITAYFIHEMSWWWHGRS